MAPLFVATGLIYGLSTLLLPKNESWGIMLRSGWTYLFSVIVFFIALGMSPSRQDFKALPAFLAAAFVVVLVGYVLVIALSGKWSLSGAEKKVEAALKTANAGLLFVLAMVAVTCGVFLIVHWLLRRRR
jgi:nucleoside permease NupC